MLNLLLFLYVLYHRTNTVRMELMIDGGTNPQQREAIIKQAFDEVCNNIEKTINDLDEVKHLMDVSLKQKAYIENLEAELNECKMLNNQLMSDLDADEGLAEICVNEFIADTIKAVKDAGVKKITVEF